jgi:hypothetical protein
MATDDEKTKKDRKKKARYWHIRVDEDLDEQAKKYADQRKVSIGALIRRLIGLQTDPEDPRELPPGMAEEKKRPPRKKKK